MALTKRSRIDWNRLRAVPIFPHSRASKTRARVEITTREKNAFLAWGDFHARSRFARSTTSEEKWGLLVV